MRYSCSCIQKRFRKFSPKDKLCLNGVNGERRMHHRLSDAVVEAILTGGARCAPATPPIALQRRELSCRSDVA
jgi:hypothetical protein